MAGAPAAADAPDASFNMPGACERSRGLKVELGGELYSSDERRTLL